MKRISILLILTALMLCACKAKPAQPVVDMTAPVDLASEEADVDQLAAPASGDTIVTMTVQGFGDIKMRLFPDKAPKAVENFTELAKQGYYDGVTFHRVMNDFMIQGGDPTGTGNGGESVWGGSFEDEFTDLVPIRGALCMANSGADTNGSQFFIVQTAQTYEAYLDQFGLNDAQKKLFKENGGTPWLYQAHTVFGQVYEGMDVVDQIAAVETDSNDKPLTDVVIEHIEVAQAE